MTVRFDWRKALVYAHRWMGILGGLLVLMWFASGIVMIYHRMPEVGVAERLERLRPIDPSGIRIAPAEAALLADAPRRGFGLTMLGERPVYRFGTRTVFADTGEALEGLSTDEALALAGDFSPDNRASLAYDALLTGPDQWTLETRAFLPLHRIALGDEEDTDVYIADRSGEVVMRTTRSGRAWGYAGAVLHWLYFTPFRVHSTLWAQTIIWLSVAGCLLSLSGLLWGLMRFSPVRPHRIQGRRSLKMSPYAGLLGWHHYAGLAFGLFSFTWMLSGGLSMDPWSWHPGTAPTTAQREALSLGPLSLEGVTADAMRRAVAALAAEGAGPLKQTEWVQFRGLPYLVGHDGAAQRLVSATVPEEGVFDRFPSADLIDAAAEAMPGVGIRGIVSLEEYDSYYYDRTGAAGLPVLRVDYADPRETALYIDPRRGVIVRKEERLTRLNRWLYHGFHSLDFPVLYGSRPLWDIVVILLSLGGIVLSATTLWPGWQRVVRHARRITTPTR